MVFRHYRVLRLYPAVDPQCSVVNGLGVACAVNCYTCRIATGQMTTMVNMLEEYPELVRRTGRRTPSLTGRQAHSALDADDVVAEIDAGRPIIAGISPSGFSYPDNLAEHVALVVSY